MNTLTVNQTNYPATRTLAANWQSQLGSLLLVANFLGYPLVGILGSFFGMDNRSLSIPFRVGMLALSIPFLIQLITRPSVLRLNLALIVFWSLYLVRLVWDSYSVRISGAQSDMLYFGGICIFPALAMAVAASYDFDEKRIAWMLAIGGGTISGLALLSNVMGWGADHSLLQITNRLSFEALNPITLGHVGATTAVAVLVLVHFKPTPLQWICLGILLFAGLACLIQAASRGALVSLAFCGLTYAVYTKRWFVTLFVAALFIPQLMDEDQQLWKSIQAIFTGKEISAQGRLDMQEMAIRQFIDEPLLGSAYVVKAYRSYPHNVFVETAMALGVVGLASLGVMLWRTTKSALRLVRGGSILFPMLFFQFIMAFQFSGSLWGSAPFWVSVAVVNSLPLKRGIR